MAPLFGSAVVWYLFLAGAGSGAFLIATLMDLRVGDARDGASRIVRPLVEAGALVGFLMVMLGAVFLLVDLGKPDRAYELFTSPHLTAVTVGSWALLLFGICAFYLVGVSKLGFPEPSRGVLLSIKVAAIFFAAVIMVYAGILLASLGAVSFWSSPLIPILFVLSALSSGLGVLMACAPFLPTAGFLGPTLRTASRRDFIVIGLEVAAVVALLVTTQYGSSLSVSLVLTGSLALAFWLGYVACGLVAPVLVGLALSRSFTPNLSAFMGVLLLIGGFSLRYWVVNAGVHESAAHLLGAVR